MLTKVLVFIISLTLYSCGQQINRDTPRLGVTYIDSSVGEPILLEKKDSSFSCPSLQTNDLDSPIEVRLFNNWFSQQENYVLKANTKGGLVTDQYFHAINFSGSFNYYENYIKRKFTYVEDAQSISFRVCPGYDYSKEYTYDSAAASAIYSFKDIKNLFKQIQVNIDSVKVRVAPIVTLNQEYIKDKRIIKNKKTLVNNAFYYSKKKEIVFLPQGKNKNGKIPFSAIPLWEIPFVGAHEYGHHLFSSVMTNYEEYRQNLNSNALSLCFDNRENIIKNENLKDGADRKVTINDVFSSMNEGVADLFARAVVSKKYKLESIGCFEFTRDVDSTKFANGQLKRLDNKVLERFLHNKRVRTSNCYTEQDFQDPHIIGAIIANGIYEIFDLLSLNQKQRVEVIVDWLSLTNNEFNSIKTKSVQVALEHVINNGIKVILKKYQPAMSDLCQIISRSFPSIRHLNGCQ